MSAYVIAIRECTKSQPDLERYWANVRKSFDGRSCKIVARHGSVEAVEGAQPESVIILEFPTMEEAQDWYRSPLYQEVLQYRLAGATYRVLIAEGLEIPIQGATLP
ncbi:DUF1330 domain-containing protein [Burkholderia anthina]|uniref:DUF1330 domain-containing protein n=1 Tax=Burkholderia anthina TaxID=179879 RepID=UPI00158DACD4|nr:DUF1330 domain-containing protein [Burkholderia anthina]